MLLRVLLSLIIFYSNSYHPGPTEWNHFLALDQGTLCWLSSLHLIYMQKPIFLALASSFLCCRILCISYISGPFYVFNSWNIFHLFLYSTPYNLGLGDHGIRYQTNAPDLSWVNTLCPSMDSTQLPHQSPCHYQAGPYSRSSICSSFLDYSALSADLKLADGSLSWRNITAAFRRYCCCCRCSCVSFRWHRTRRQHASTKSEFSTVTATDYTKW